ncbi:hypothetical protein JCM19274_3086 [Algibacter lectus]|uniref:Uncharacterized protein n=1 Tax=Algibacter lectus TaxID=221126 RepID=A0A090WW78_9FLAO|nr:hypothetical protein JCM19274_3086 [Algibacter lectus]
MTKPSCQRLLFFTIIKAKRDIIWKGKNKQSSIFNEGIE